MTKPAVPHCAWSERISYKWALWRKRNDRNDKANAAAASNVTTQAENQSHHSWRASWRKSDSFCTARKAPEPSRGEGAGVRLRRPSRFISPYGSNLTVDAGNVMNNDEMVQVRYMRKTGLPDRVTHWGSTSQQSSRYPNDESGLLSVIRPFSAAEIAQGKTSPFTCACHAICLQVAQRRGNIEDQMDHRRAHSGARVAGSRAGGGAVVQSDSLDQKRSDGQRAARRK